MKYFIIGHLIGTITTIIIHIKSGVFKWATKNGDGLRWANPADILFYDLIGWEIQAFLNIWDKIEDFINNIFKQIYK